MTVVMLVPANRMIVSDRPEILHEVHRDDIGMALWRRSLSAELAAGIERLAPADLPDGRLLVRPDEIPAALPELFPAGEAFDGPLRLALVSDVADLVGRFATITGSDRVDVRLEAIVHDACWKFHRDRVRLRLLTTYRGPGTQFVDRKHATRAIREQSAYDGPVENMPRHAVALFKGDEGGVVHRSPPIVGTGITRLLLCLNVPSVVSPDAWRPASR